MPIRINLLAEQLSLEEARRRDPVKRAVWVGGFVVSLVVFWAAVLQIKVISVKSDLATEQAKLKKLEKNSKAVAADLKLISETERKIAALQSLATNRFLWAPTLDALQNVMVDNIQVVRFRADQAFTKTSRRLTEKELERNPNAKAPEVVSERKTLLIEARDFANPAELNHNKFISEIAATDVFKRTLEKADSINLKDRLPAQPDPADPRRRFIPFSIECKYPEKQRTL